MRYKEFTIEKNNGRLTTKGNTFIISAIGFLVKIWQTIWSDRDNRDWVPNSLKIFFVCLQKDAKNSLTSQCLIVLGVLVICHPSTDNQSTIKFYDATVLFGFFSINKYQNLFRCISATLSSISSGYVLSPAEAVNECKWPALHSWHEIPETCHRIMFNFM